MSLDIISCSRLAPLRGWPLAGMALTGLWLSLVIAALVGTTGLGQQIFQALTAADTGLGLIAGLSMALLAMVTDRVMQAWAARRFAGMAQS